MNWLYSFAITVVFCAESLAISADQTLQRLNRDIAASTFSGVVYAVNGDEIVFNASYGLANTETKTAFNAQTVLDIGSITKQFTVAAVLKLAEQNKLSLKDSLAKYFVNIPIEMQTITLHQLMTHSAGFAYSAGPVHELINKHDFRKRVFNTPLLFKPGSQYAHSNVGFGLLTQVIEKVSGQGYEQFIHSNILLPAGLKETGYRLISREETDLAIHYENKPNVFEQIFSMTPKRDAIGHSLVHFYESLGKRWNIEGSTGYLSTVQDMSAWYQAIRDKKVLTKQSWDLIFTEHVGNGSVTNTQHGYGWSMGETKEGRSYFYHQGRYRGALSIINYYPDIDLFVFIMTNCRDDYPYEMIEKLTYTIQKKTLQLSTL
ncbi:serine hydrolase domain-containing protein [Pseudoalteromonas sp. MMG005]|uniref:serine hydrolase domain-containing protein n=1 Tax=Pseudoalteromonas sp. MMG005 TaxID=2822682 RepID=UPI001B3A2106|nr:serine hydrolase domain-containing protein [Pseudoalteromonas sp. MMG005]MBQ4848377.1 beta-lactamase family protein [Pseudoalteromonas sp. MMG005]